MAYVDVPFEPSDPDLLLADALDRLTTLLPGYTPRQTQPEYAILAEASRLVADTRALAADVPDAIFRTFGADLYGIPALAGTPATGTAVFTVEAQGQIVPAGTAVAWSPDPLDPAAEVVEFVTVAAVTGATAVSGGFDTQPVQIVADVVGEAGNDLPTGALLLTDPLTYVTAVRATAVSSGGTEPEDDRDYLDRLTDSLTLLRRVPVLARDFAVLARDVPGVYRALALDNYNPANGTSNNERMVAVAAVDEQGAAVAGSVLAELDARLQSEREVNFVVNTFAPTYTAVTVTFTATCTDDFDPATVQAEAIQAVTDYLSPAFWAGGRERPPTWRAETTVRRLDVAGVLFTVPGVLHVTALTLNGSSTADVTLTGAAPLPTPTVSGTVTAV